MSDDYYAEFLAYRRIPDGRLVAVLPLTFGRARIVIGPDQALWYDDGW